MLPLQAQLPASRRVSASVRQLLEVVAAGQTASKEWQQTQMNIQIFSIDRYWKSCTIYEAASTHQLVGRSTITLDKGLTRSKRHELISGWLEKHGLKCPPVGGNKAKGK